jgi:hypothetical protein
VPLRVTPGQSRVLSVAVSRVDEEMPESAERWKEWLGHAGVLLTAAGIIVYGVVSQAYGAFYGALGVDPQDVGLSYAATLSHSIKFIVMLTAGLYICVPLLPVGRSAFGLIRTLNRLIWRTLDPVGLSRRGLTLHVSLYRDLRAELRERLGPRWWWRRRRDPQATAIIEQRLAQADSDSAAILKSLDDEAKLREKLLDESLGKVKRDLRELDPFGAVIATVITTILLLVILIFPFAQAHRDARSVRAGHAIQSPGILDPFNPLAIRAELATVSSAVKPGEMPALDRLGAMSLIYLGKADGTAVFYDPVGESAVYLPVGSMVIEMEPNS